jgi:hypothetical protein
MSQGREPHLFSTQFHILDDGRTLIHDGPEGGPQVRAIIGGMGDFSGASGEVFEEPLGTNSTGLFNIRFTTKINKKSIKVIRSRRQSPAIRVARPIALPLTRDHLS